MKLKIEDYEPIEIHGMSEQGRTVYAATSAEGCYEIQEQAKGKNLLSVNIYRHEKVIREMVLLFNGFQIDESDEGGTGQAMFLAIEDVFITEDDRRLSSL